MLPKTAKSSGYSSTHSHTQSSPAHSHHTQKSKRDNNESRMEEESASDWSDDVAENIHQSSKLLRKRKFEKLAASYNNHHSYEINQ